MKRIRPEDIEKHIRVLTEDIGVRLAGSDGERAAVAYIADQLRETGAEVSVEKFPVRERAVEQESLELSIDGEWRPFACSLLGNAAGTNGNTLEAPLAFFTCPTDYRRQDFSFLSGKAVVHLGTHIETADNYRRMVEAKPAFLIFVDVRYPGTVATADGMFPAYTHAYGALPIVSVAFMDAWNWREKGATAAKLRVVGGMRDSSSQNVAAELPGSDPDPGLVLVGAHHDTQADSVGADDNAVGVAAVLELTRALIELPRKRAIRLISFGAEEQLSVGSATYVRRHREELHERGKFMLNFDSYGSLLGWSELSCCGSEEMGRYLDRFFVARDEYPVIKHELMPYADHFPFAVAGMPSATLIRSNCTAGRFFHHRPDDNISRVGTSLAAKLVEAGGEALAEIAAAETVPFPSRITGDLQVEVQKKWLELFGGWAGFGG